MNKIEKIQKLFHTDKWWGKAVFIFLVYLLFFVVFYGTWILITFSFGEYEYYKYNTILFLGLLFLYIILPIITFFVFPKFLKKITQTKFPYIINSIFIFLILLVFTFLRIVISVIQFYNQGFF